METLVTYVAYLWQLLRHKWFVMLFCFRERLIWRGLVHDLSKFLPSEFVPYARYFFPGGKKKVRRDRTGYYKPTDTGDPRFDQAWFLHQKRNEHHWQYWALPEDVEGVKILPMTDRARREMVCDWKGAGRAQGTPDTRAWFRKNSHKLQLHPETRRWLEERMGS